MNLKEKVISILKSSRTSLTDEDWPHIDELDAVIEFLQSSNVRIQCNGDCENCPMMKVEK